MIFLGGGGVLCLGIPFFFFFFFLGDVCFRAWLNMGFCERREGGLGSVAGCGCDYCMMGVERS